MAETFAADPQSYEGKHFCGAAALGEMELLNFLPRPLARLVLAAIAHAIGPSEQMFGAE
jgi:hypothetical protein